jgi:CcmD family protein
MNAIAFLKAAYIVAWVIYVGYLVRILLRMRKVEEEIRELDATGTPRR